MAETVANSLVSVRRLIDEVAARQWEDLSLRRWLWEGTQDVARRTWCMRGTTDVVIAQGAQTSTVPATIFKIEDVLWLPGGGDLRELPLEGRPYHIFNRVRAQNPAITGTPMMYTLFGTAPTLSIRVFPTPYQASTLRLYGALVPAPWDFVAPSPIDTVKTLEIPDGWTDLAVNYCAMRAMLADKDASGTGWQTFANLYEAQLAELKMHAAYETYADEVVPVYSNYGYDDD